MNIRIIIGIGFTIFIIGALIFLRIRGKEK